MKKRLIILCSFLVLLGNVFANVEQADWRWRNDDGNDANATWKSPKDTGMVVSPGTTVRLRILIGNGQDGAKDYSRVLKWSTSSIANVGTWTEVPTAVGAENSPISYTTSAFVNNLDSTDISIIPAKDVNWATYIYNKGNIFTSKPTTVNANLLSKHKREYEYVIKLSAFAKNNTKYYFKVTNDNYSIGDPNGTKGELPNLTYSYAVNETVCTWDGALWTPAAPTMYDNVLLSGNYSGAAFSCNNLTVNAGIQFTLTSGTLNVSGNLLFKSDAINGTATFVNGTNVVSAGNTIVQQYLTGSFDPVAKLNGRFWYLSSPVSGAKGSTFNAGGRNKVWSFVEAKLAGTVYMPITKDSTLGTGRAYVARMGADTTINFVGPLNTGDKNVKVTRTGSTVGKRGFNLVGNPYPSFITLNPTDNPTLQTTLWHRVVSDNAMVFDTYNLSLHTSLSGTLTAEIPPMQSFWVRVNADASSTNVVFKNANRSHQSGVRLRNTQESTNENVRLQVSNGKYSDLALIGFYNEAVDGTDNFDSPKMSNGVDSIPEIYTIVDNEEMAINSLKATNNDCEFALGFRTGVKGHFTIKAKDILNFAKGTRVVLKDKLLDTEQDLTVNPDYTFTSDSIQTSERFSVSVNKVVTGLSQVTNKLSVFAVANGGLKVILDGFKGKKGTISILNALGQQVQSSTISIENPTFNTTLKHGIYLVKVSSEGFNMTKTILINK